MLFWKTLVRVNHFKIKKISNVHTLLFQTINTLEIWNRHLMNSLELLMTQNRPFCFSRLLIMIFFAVYILLTKNYFYKYISQYYNQLCILRDIFNKRYIFQENLTWKEWIKMIGKILQCWNTMGSIISMFRIPATIGTGIAEGRTTMKT